MLEGAWGIQIIGRPQEGIQVSDVSEKYIIVTVKRLDSLDYQLKR
jgi:hypothetical protein